MADETQIPELKRLIEVVIQKVDGLASDVRTNTYSIDRLEGKVDRHDTRFDKLETDVGTIKSDLKILTGQFTFVGKMTMDDNERIDGLERRVDILEHKPH